MSDPAREMLDQLVGAWHGTGSVEMPTMPSTDFVETIRFERRTPTLLDYWQLAESAEGEPMHTEVGIWRVGSPGRLEMSIALPGTTEIAEGAVVGGSIETVSTAVGRAERSTRLVRARRRYRVTDGTLAYEVDLESVNFPMTFHLRAVLHRR